MEGAIAPSPFEDVLGNSLLHRHSRESGNPAFFKPREGKKKLGPRLRGGDEKMLCNTPFEGGKGWGSS